MQIRRLVAADYEDVVKLWSKAGLPFRPKGRDSRKAITAEMKANPDFFLGAFENDCLVGAVVISCDLRKGWINRLAVDPEWRNRGIAKEIIEESERTLRKRGIRLFCALIEDTNVISKSLFKKCGYIEHSDIRYFSKRYDDQI